LSLVAHAIRTIPDRPFTVDDFRRLRIGRLGKRVDDSRIASHSGLHDDTERIRVEEGQRFGPADTSSMKGMGAAGFVSAM
jgi:hypothetical protein